MEHSETLCHFCGVSYLIFHEFHQLQTQLAHLEDELQKLGEEARGQKAQKEALEQGRLEWERTLRLELQRQTQEKEQRMKEELEEKKTEVDDALREELQRKTEAMEEERQNIWKEKEMQLRRQLADLEAEKLRKQQGELERSFDDREKVLSDALQKANKHADELRKYLQQLEKR